MGHAQAAGDGVDEEIGVRGRRTRVDLLEAGDVHRVEEGVVVGLTGELEVVGGIVAFRGPAVAVRLAGLLPVDGIGRGLLRLWGGAGFCGLAGLGLMRLGLGTFGRGGAFAIPGRPGGLPIRPRGVGVRKGAGRLEDSGGQGELPVGSALLGGRSVRVGCVPDGRIGRGGPAFAGPRATMRLRSGGIGMRRGAPDRIGDRGVSDGDAGQGARCGRGPDRGALRLRGEGARVLRSARKGLRAARKAGDAYGGQAEHPVAEGQALGVLVAGAGPRVDDDLVHARQAHLVPRRRVRAGGDHVPRHVAEAEPPAQGRPDAVVLAQEQRELGHALRRRGPVAQAFDHLVEGRAGAQGAPQPLHSLGVHARHGQRPARRDGGQKPTRSCTSRNDVHAPNRPSWVLCRRRRSDDRKLPSPPRPPARAIGGCNRRCRPRAP